LYGRVIILQYIILIYQKEPGEGYQYRAQHPLDYVEIKENTEYRSKNNDILIASTVILDKNSLI
jgi:hypothetical protein